jgi:hypothetical protein
MRQHNITWPVEPEFGFGNSGQYILKRDRGTEIQLLPPPFITIKAMPATVAAAPPASIQVVLSDGAPLNVSTIRSLRDRFAWNPKTNRTIPPASNAMPISLFMFVPFGCGAPVKKPACSRHENSIAIQNRKARKFSERGVQAASTLICKSR